MMNDNKTGLIGVILAAGMAKRLRPLTDEKPKCLLEVGGKTLLQRTVEAMTATGITELVVVTGYRAGQIRDFFNVQVSARPKDACYQRDARMVYDSNYWLTTITLDPALKVKGQENAYKQMVTGAVGGAAGVIHTASTPVTDCQPNDNVEAMRLALLAAGIESRPLWKPMHKQPVYASAPAYVNGVSESLFKVGMCLPTGPCVSDEDVEYIVNTIKDNIL